MNEFLIYVLIFIPISSLIGVATATISFTAWMVIVPLLFSGFSLTLFESLFISASVDMINGFIMGAKFSRDNLVHWRYALGLGLIAISGEVVGLAFSKNLLTKESSLLKGSVGYLDFLLALFFLIRGYLMYRNSKKAQDEGSNEHEEGSLLNSSDEEIGKQQDRASQEVLFPSDSVSDTNPTTKVQSRTVFWGLLVGVFLFSFGSGGLSGLAGFGSGLNFSLILIILQNFDVLEATGTASVIMSQLMAVLFVVYQTPLFSVDFLRIWRFWIVAVSFSAVGTIVGAIFVTKISKIQINFVIALVCIFVGIYTTVQTEVLKKH